LFLTPKIYNTVRSAITAMGEEVSE